MSSERCYWPGWAADPEQESGALIRYSSTGGLEFYDGSSSGSFRPLKETLLEQEIRVGSGGDLAGFDGLSDRVKRAERTRIVLSEDEYAGSGAVFSGGEIELCRDEAHESAGKQVLIRHPLTFSGCRKVSLKGVRIRPETASSRAVVLRDGGILKMDHVTCEHCSDAVYADTGAFVFLGKENCFGESVSTGIRLDTGASAVTEEDELLDLAQTPAVPAFGSEGEKLTRNGAVTSSGALTENGIILRDAYGTLSSANFSMRDVTVSSGWRISAGPHASGIGISIAAGGEIHLHLVPRTFFSGSSGNAALTVVSGHFSGFSGNVSSLIIGSGASVSCFSGSADVEVRSGGVFSSSVLSGGSLIVHSGGVTGGLTLGSGVTSSSAE